MSAALFPECAGLPLHCSDAWCLTLAFPAGCPCRCSRRWTRCWPTGASTSSLPRRSECSLCSVFSVASVVQPWAHLLENCRSDPEIRLLGDSFLVCSGSAFIYILRATKKHQLLPWGLGAPAVRTGNNRWGVAPDGGLQSAQWWAVDWMVEWGSQRACDGHGAGTWSR